MKGLDYNGRPEFKKERALFEEPLGTDLFKKIDKLPEATTERQQELDKLFKDIAKTYIKGNALQRGLSEMDPAGFIPIGEEAESVRASARRLDKDQSINGTRITFSMYQQAIDKTFADNSKIQAKYLDIKLPVTTVESSRELSDSKSEDSEVEGFIKAFLDENGIAGTVLAMLTLAPFQSVIFQTLTVEQGARAVNTLQIPAGLAIFIELGIKAERIYRMLKKANPQISLTESQVVDLENNETARAEALGKVGIDHQDLKKSFAANDAKIIIDYVSEYYRRYGGLQAPNSHLTIDHWIGYLQVAQNQNMLNSALRSSPKFTDIFENIAPTVQFSPGGGVISESVRTGKVRAHVDLVGVLNDLNGSSKTIYDEVINAFTYHITDRDLCCVSGDTRIQTKHGARSIKELVGSEIEVWNGTKWSKTKPFLAKKDQKLYRVYISDGSFLDCTDDHEWSVCKPSPSAKIFKKKKTSELTVGMKLPRFNLDTSQTGEHLEFAYEYGYFLGDGSTISKNCYSIRIPIFTSELNLDKITKSCHIGHISGPFDVSENGYNYPKWIWYIPELDKSKCSSLKGPNKKGLPDWLFTLDKESILNFIGGYIDSDGNLSSNGKTDQYRIFGSEDKLRDLQLLCRKANINFTTLRLESEKPTNKGSRTEPLWALTIHSHNCSEIKTRFKTSNNFSSRFVSNGRSKVDKARWQRITKVELLEGIHDTYCFDEPENHMGVFGNVLTHQCLVQLFGSVGDPELLRTIALLIRIVATDLSGEIARIDNILRRYIQREIQGVIFEVVTQLNEMYDKIQSKVSSIFTLDLDAEACGGLLTVGFAILQSIRTLYNQIQSLIGDISQMLMDFGEIGGGSWQVAAERRHLLGIAKVLEVIATKIELVSICDEEESNEDIELEFKDKAANEVITNILEVPPPSVQLTNEELAKYFPDTPIKSSERFKFSYGINYDEDAETNNGTNTDGTVNNCGRSTSKEKIDEMTKVLLRNIQDTFANE